MESNLTAMRFAQKPLHQPTYSFSHVPKAVRDLKGSSLQRIDNREHFLTIMAEMLLLCKEAMRRRPGKPHGGSKPLSLEYIADRCDIDDPLFGFIVRTKENPASNPHSKTWKEGMLQGFISVTTFTNWQRTFRWDSSNPAAFETDSEEMEAERLSGERKWDSFNDLAKDLQQTVHYGDIWGEGVVWPRIAEIALLGGLGCGKALVELVIEQLECMKPTDEANYEYVVLQATENSIPFYESLGFVRVGAVTDIDEAEQNKRLREEPCTHDSAENDGAPSEAAKPESLEKACAPALPDHIVSCEMTTFIVKKAGTTLSDVAKKFHVDAWDLLYLNNQFYSDLSPSSRLMAGTSLQVPVKSKAEASAPGKTRTSLADTPQYYIAKENDTPRTISRRFKLNCIDLVEANKGRLPGLISSSRLRNGTRVKISHLEVPDTSQKPYAHWSFPDDNFEEGEPSYMMARKLNKKRGKNIRVRPVESSLVVPISEYQPTPLLLPPPPPPPCPVRPLGGPVTTSLNKICDGRPDEPKPPKKPLGPYFFYTAEQRELQRNEAPGLSVVAASKLYADQWKEMSDDAKAKYVAMSEQAKIEYYEAKARYQKDIAAYRAKYPQLDEPETPAVSLNETLEDGVHDLFNKVVKLKPQAITEGSDYTYWYVLTYIPDLRWCHLAPMVQVGTFGKDKPKAEGRPKFVLVDESLGKEVDISAGFCIPIKARFMKRTLDADKEEWDVIDDGKPPTERKVKNPRILNRDDGDCSLPTDSVDMTDTASGVYSHQSGKSDHEKDHRLVASYPGTSKTFYVTLQGACISTQFNRPQNELVSNPSALDCFDVLGLLSVENATKGAKAKSQNNSMYQSLKGVMRKGSGAHGSKSRSIAAKTKLSAENATKGAKAEAQNDSLNQSHKGRSLASSPRTTSEAPECSLDSVVRERSCDHGGQPVKRKRGRPRKSESGLSGAKKARSHLALEQVPSWPQRPSATKSVVEPVDDLCESESDNPCKFSSGRNELDPSRLSSHPSALARNLSARNVLCSDLPDSSTTASSRTSVTAESLNQEGCQELRGYRSSFPRTLDRANNMSPVRKARCPEDPPRSTTKRWHPVRDTRNGKITPIARRSTPL